MGQADYPNLPSLFLPHAHRSHARDRTRSLLSAGRASSPSALPPPRPPARLHLGHPHRLEQPCRDEAANPDGTGIAGTPPQPDLLGTTQILPLWPGSRNFPSFSSGHSFTLSFGGRSRLWPSFSIWHRQKLCERMTYIAHLSFSIMMD
jgi:hypothetical protein